MAKYSVGLDIGISSVGWAIIDIETKQIVNLGSRIFPSGNAAGNQERRSFRGTRRLIRRRKNRLTDLKKLLGETFCSFDIFPYYILFSITLQGLTFLTFRLMMVFLLYSRVVQKLVQINCFGAAHFLSLLQLYLPYTCVSLLIQVNPR